MATVSTPQAVSQSASVSRSAVKVSKRRTGSGSQSGGTATQWTPSWMSMPVARGFFTVRAGWGLGAEGVVSRRGTGDLRWAAIGISAGREGTNAEGRRAKWGCSLPNGIRSGRVFDPATLSPTKQSRPPGPRCTTGTKHQGLSGHGPPLRDHDDRRAQENPGFLTDAPPPGRRGTLYWNLRRFRTGRRKDQTPYDLLGLKLPDLSFWEFLKLTPERLREQLSAQEDTP